MVILVDENDKEVGIEEKIKAHEGGGKLHRAFSIFVFNSEGKMLLQKRAKTKYHSGGLWTNACCSHPSPEKSLSVMVHKRLKEEMGFDCELEEVFSFKYKIHFDNGLTEWEYDHVFIGEFNGEIKPNQKEVSEWKWVDLKELQKDVNKQPQNYAYWFKIALNRVIACYNNFKDRQLKEHA